MSFPRGRESIRFLPGLDPTTARLSCNLLKGEVRDPVLSLACSTVIAQMFPSLSRSSSVFSSRSLLSDMWSDLNSMYRVSVAWKYLIFTAGKGFGIQGSGFRGDADDGRKRIRDSGVRIQG
jgi:hypothetical protein